MQIRVIAGILSVWMLVAIANGQPTTGTTQPVMLRCPGPCEEQCEFEIATNFTYDEQNNLVVARLCHRKRPAPPGSDCISDILPGKSSITFAHATGLPTTLEFDPNSETNEVGHRNNVNDFIRDLQNNGWEFVVNEGVNCMQYANGAGIRILNFRFDSIFVCECPTPDGNGESHFRTVTTTTSGRYNVSTDRESGPHESFVKGPTSTGVSNLVPDDFGTGYSSIEYDDSQIPSSERIGPNTSRQYELSFSVPFDLATPKLLLKPFNIRDAFGQSDVRVFLDGIEIPEAFDRHNLDVDADSGGVQGFVFPLKDDALRNAVLDGTTMVSVEHAATDGQFIAIDYVGLLFPTIVPIEVIYTKISTHPTSVVPGAIDLNGNPAATNFRSLEDLIFSPDGSQWIVKGRTQLGSLLENILILGTGTLGTRFIQEGEPVLGGGTDERYEFFGSAIGRFDANGNFAFSARARNGASDTGTPPNAQRVLLWEGATFSLAFKQNDPISGLIDQAPNPSGDELFGNSVGSIHLLNDGRIGSQDGTIVNIHTSRRPAIMYDSQAFHQSNVTTFIGIDGVTSRTWATIGTNSFFTTPDGGHWMAQGRYVGQPTTDTELVLDGQAVLETGQPIGGSGAIVNTISFWELISSGDWFARGTQPDDNDWAARNGVLVAKTGDPITPGSTETWGDTFLSFTGNRIGDWVLVGNTSEADTARDTVIVLNGQEVIAREGDAVNLDLDNNGQFDDAFIGRGSDTLAAFESGDLFIGDDRLVYFFASLRDAASVDLNSNPAFGAPQAFLRIDLGGHLPCPGDLDGDGDRDLTDLAILLADFGCVGIECPGDVDGDGDTALIDLALLLSEFGRPCP